MEDQRQSEEKLRRKFEEHQRRQAAAEAKHDAQVAQASQTLAETESEARRACPIPRYGVLVILAAIHVLLGLLALTWSAVYALEAHSANDKEKLFFATTWPIACAVAIGGLLFVTLGAALVTFRDVARNSWKQLSLLQGMERKA